MFNPSRPVADRLAALGFDAAAAAIASGECVINIAAVSAAIDTYEASDGDCFFDIYGRTFIAPRFLRNLPTLDL